MAASSDSKLRQADSALVHEAGVETNLKHNPLLGTHPDEHTADVAEIPAQQVTEVM